MDQIIQTAWELFQHEASKLTLSESLCLCVIGFYTLAAVAALTTHLLKQCHEKFTAAK